MDNFAIYHICSEKYLFAREIYNIECIGVRGISGSDIVEGVCTVVSMVTDSNEIKRDIKICKW